MIKPGLQIVIPLVLVIAVMLKVTHVTGFTVQVLHISSFQKLVRNTFTSVSCSGAVNREKVASVELFVFCLSRQLDELGPVWILACWNRHNSDIMSFSDICGPIRMNSDLAGWCVEGVSLIGGEVFGRRSRVHIDHVVRILVIDVGVDAVCGCDEIGTMRVRKSQKL